MCGLCKSNNAGQPRVIIRLSCYDCAIHLAPARPPLRANSHVQALLSFGSLVLGAVAHDSVAVRQVEVECDQRAVLQAQGPQCGAVNLQGGGATHRQEDGREYWLGKLQRRTNPKYSWKVLVADGQASKRIPVLCFLLLWC